MTLRQLLGILGGSSIQKIGDQVIIDKVQSKEVNPISREKTPVHSWETGQSYQLPSVNVELILCNERVNRKMCVRYVLIDPEFFILIEPDFSNQTENRIIIHYKVPLKHVESLIDKSDARNLMLGFAVIQSSQQWTTKEILIYFENTVKCSYVKNMLDHTKKTFKQQQIQKVNLFLDKCKNQYGLM